MYHVSSEEEAVLPMLHALVVHTFCIHFTGVVRARESCTISRAGIAWMALCVEMRFKDANMAS